LKEWALYLNLFKEKPQIKELHLGGGTPTFFKAENLKLLVDGILQNCDLHAEAEFSFEAHPANTTETHLQVLYELKFRRLSLGIQDFDPLVQDTIHRFQSVGQVAEVTQQARTIGYTSINYDMIFGLPKQTERSIQNTIAEVIRLKPDRIAYYSYAHVPWHKPGQRKFTEADLPSGTEKRRLYEIGKSMLLKEGYEDIGMDHFSLPNEAMYLALQDKGLHRNFMGYTDKKTQLLIGLGVSAISDAGNAYGQNLKTIESYRQQIDMGHWATYKGYELNNKDIYIKDLITKLICNFEVTWCKSYFEMDEILNIYDRLRELENDGLIVIDHQNIQVTTLGTAFIRNICSAFDMYMYHDHQSQEEKFSKAV
jgi:oxygen-independent coproporphyrinogen-3 oxidase